ncbi:unnamed protein product [Cutaneotrichosporon oleaginosum]
MSPTKLSKVAIAGIVIGATIVLLVVLILAYFIRYFRKLEHESQFDRQIAALAPRRSTRPPTSNTKPG